MKPPTPPATATTSIIIPALVMTSIFICITPSSTICSMYFGCSTLEATSAIISATEKTIMTVYGLRYLNILRNTVI